MMMMILWAFLKYLFSRILCWKWVFLSQNKKIDNLGTDDDDGDDDVIIDDRCQTVRMAQNCSVECGGGGVGRGRRWWRLGTVTLSRSRPQSHTHCRAAESEARWWSNGESMWLFRWFYYPLAFNQLNVQFGGDALMFDILISISHFKRKLDYKQNIEVKSRNSNSSQCENFQCKLYQIRFY